MSESLIAKLAEKAVPELGGVDWEALEKALGIPREEVVYHTSAGSDTGSSGWTMYQTYMTAAYERANKALDDRKIVMTWGVKDNPETAANEVNAAVAAWDAIQDDTLSIGDTVLKAFQSNVAFLRSEDAMVTDTESLRAMISSVYMVSLFGSVVHMKGMMQLSDVAPEDIIESADNITRSFNAIAKLAELGILDSLRDPNQPLAVVPAGLGALPAAVLITIVAVVGIAIIAWCIVAVVKQMEVNRAIRLMCEAAAKTGSQSDKDRCAELVEMNLTATQGGPLEAITTSIGKAAIMVGVAFAMFMLVPPLASMLKLKGAKA